MALECSNRNIHREKVTGARADRRELNRMLGKLAPGDVVTVTRIDRLARSTFDLFGIVKRIVDAKAQFRSLAEPWADSTSSTGRNGRKRQAARQEKTTPLGRGADRVDHGAGEYARGEAHVSTAELFFALLKRGIVGSFHHVSPEHLHRYCDEFSFRWDYRSITDSDRTEIAIQQTKGKRLSYRQPTRS